MERLTPISYIYYPSQTRTEIRKYDDIQDILDDGWELSGRNNGYHVFIKPAIVKAKFALQNNTEIIFDIRPYILAYYNLKTLRKNRLNMFWNDLLSGNIIIYLDDGNNILIC